MDLMYCYNQPNKEMLKNVSEPMYGKTVHT